MHLFDSLRNFITGMGTARDKSVASSWHWDQITDFEAEAMYASSWAARKAVDIIPDDETREWRTWQAEQAEALYAAERDLRLRARVQLARKWERLYGGAAILIGTGDPEPLEPLDVTKIQRGGLRYLHVIPRKDISADQWEDDITAPNFGKPRTYQITTGRSARQIVVHNSRLVVFDGLDAPREYREVMQGFGFSILQVLRSAVTDAESTARNAAVMMHEATLDVIKIQELQSYLADAESERRLMERFMLAQMAKGTVKALILGGDETYDRKQTSFTGIPEMMNAHHEVVAAALDMPLTRFMGRSPGGLNSTGDNELRNYYDMIRSRQATDLADTLKPLDDALKAHCGAIGDDVTYEWASLWVPSPMEKADIEKIEAEVDTAYVNMGLFPQEGMARTIRDRLIARGTYPSLDQHVPEEDLEFEPVDFTPPPVEGEGEGDEGDDDAVIGDAAPRTLYVSRKVENAAEIIAWAKSQGIEGLVPGEDLHVTIAYSRAALDWMKVGEPWNATLEIAECGPRIIERLGPAGEYLALAFLSSELRWRNEAIREAGASWDWPDYQPHITLAIGTAQDAAGVAPYQGKIVLGPEVWEELDETA